MASKRKFYRNVYVVEVLSEEPIPDDVDLGYIEHQIVEGDCSGMVKHTVSNEEWRGQAMAKLLVKQGSDPCFFRLDDDGNDLDD